LLYQLSYIGLPALFYRLRSHRAKVISIVILSAAKNPRILLGVRQLHPSR
jgi:hypothetical protein